ncbi:MAG: L-seryl-tRNA(Sec) selenium transferase [Armatimonadota bacterium]
MPDYSSLPSVTALASIPELERFPAKMRIVAAQSAIERARVFIEHGKPIKAESIVFHEAMKLKLPAFRQVQNFSGVILHTGLGRAPEILSQNQGYCNLEIDIVTGKRGNRQDHVRSLLCELTGAEDALVVNNGAGAVLLALSALCSRREVLLSRGQSVEIGGAFRMPDVIKASGCKLVDVGTTNKTKAQDYADAITLKTAAILQCHPSNFEVRGFTSAPTTKELASVGKDHGILFINDQGNGALTDFRKYGLNDVETLPQSVAAGADITIGSGDKLLGGPQCGIILGRKDLIARMAKHPLARALRIDKSNLMALHLTLRNYVFEDFEEIPLFRCLNYSADTIKEWCQALAPEGAEILDSMTEIGSGSAPGQGVKSYAIVLSSKNPDQLLASLRQASVIGRIHKGKVWLDPRTANELFDNCGIPDEEFHPLFAERFKEIITECWEQWK